jgi:hypothetical protein
MTLSLDDVRTNVANKDPIPAFMAMRLDAALLWPMTGCRGGGARSGKGALSNQPFL